jgi:hypothetical protein
MFTGGSKFIKRISRGVLSRYGMIDYSVGNDTRKANIRCNKNLEKMGYILHTEYES